MENNNVLLPVIYEFNYFNILNLSVGINNNIMINLLTGENTPCGNIAKLEKLMA